MLLFKNLKIFNYSLLCLKKIKEEVQVRGIKTGPSCMQRELVAICTTTTLALRSASKLLCIFSFPDGAIVGGRAVSPGAGSTSGWTKDIIINLEVYNCCECFIFIMPLIFVIDLLFNLSMTNQVLQDIEQKWKNQRIGQWHTVCESSIF